MGYYHPNDVERLLLFWDRAANKKQQLTLSLVQRQYRTPRAKEFALHGVGRRFSLMNDCIDVLFRALPPDWGSVPSDGDRMLATIAMQTFLINVFGAADNLARLWVEQKDVKHPNGRALRDSDIGMAQKYSHVRNSFPVAYRDYLATRENWFAKMESFRHALAHRISPYIPPYSVLPEIWPPTALLRPTFITLSVIINLKDRNNFGKNRPRCNTSAR